MRGIPEQYDVAAGPIFQWRNIIKGMLQDSRFIGRADHGVDRRVPLFESFENFAEVFLALRPSLPGEVPAELTVADISNACFASFV